MGKYDDDFTSLTVPELLLLDNNNELAEISRSLKLLIKLKLEEHKSVVLDKENKREIDLHIYKKDLEDQA